MTPRVSLLPLFLLITATTYAEPAAVDRGRQVARTLPEPFATTSAIKHPQVIGWPAGKTPTAPAGFSVSALARDLENPRWIYVLPNGDVLVAQSRTLPKPKPEGRQSRIESVVC